MICKTQTGWVIRAGRNRGNPDAKVSRLTAVVGGRAAVSIAHYGAATLKWRRAGEGHATHCAHRAETIVAGGLPLDVPDHFAFVIDTRAHSTPCGTKNGVSIALEGTFERIL